MQDREATGIAIANGTMTCPYMGSCRRLDNRDSLGTLKGPMSVMQRSHRHQLLGSYLLREEEEETAENTADVVS